MPLELKDPKPGRSPYYRVRGTYLGVYVDRSTKTAERAKALQFLRKWKEDIERGTLSRPGEPTFLDAAVNYMAATGNEKFVRRVIERFGQKPLREIDQSAVDHAAIALYPKATAATRNRQVYTVISAVLKHAGIEMALKRPKGAAGRIRTEWLSKAQAFALLDAAFAKDPEFGTLVSFMLYTGARLGEALALSTDNVDLAEGTALFPMTKNGEARVVHLPSVVVSELANHPRGMDRPAERVFRFSKCGRLYSWWKDACVKAKLPIDAKGAPVFTFHSLRHTWATWMRRYGGADTRGLVATGAWKDRKSASRYEHAVVNEEARRADSLPVRTAGEMRKMAK
ncbi:MAG: site-specific integrase [Patescibacteria group bacterium]|nr:site-specific integrase [Patescibacteria group bacterium]